MNIKEAKDACMNRLRVVVTKEGGASFRGHHIEGIIHKPDYKTGKWRPFALIAYGEDDNFTYYGSGSNGDPEIPIERVYVDRNQDSPGRTAFKKAHNELREKVKAEQLKLNEGDYYG